MKILKKDGVFRKVANDWIADNLVKTMGWAYGTLAEMKLSKKPKVKTDVIQPLE